MTDTALQALMEALDLETDGPAVVAVGGGMGLSQALAAAQRYAGRIAGVVTVADDGGSSGRLAPALDIPPPGDIRKCLLALTPDRSVWRDLFEYRFAGSDVGGHSLGNLIIAALTDLTGDFGQALVLSERLLGAVGEVIPASPTRLHLEGVVDGRVVEGQVALSRARGRITKLRVVPESARVSEQAVEAVAGADQIVIGPGSLYTSVLAALLVPGLVEAINASAARLVYVANLTTQDGETLGMDGADHLEALLEHSGLRPPAALVGNRNPVGASPPVAPVEIDPDAILTFGVDVVLGDLVDPAVERPRHDPVLLGDMLARLVSA